MKRFLIILTVVLITGAASIGLTMLSLRWMHENTMLETHKNFTGKEDDDRAETKRQWDEQAEFERENQVYPTVGGFVGVGIGTVIGVWLASYLRKRSRLRQVQSVHPKWLMPNALPLPAKPVESQVIQTKVRG